MTAANPEGSPPTGGRKDTEADGARGLSHRKTCSWSSVSFPWRGQSGGPLQEISNTPL